jgi:hypothetical protein
MCGTAKAVVELLGLADTERRRFLLVKGTPGHVVPTPLLQRHTLVDDFDDVDPGNEFIDETLWDTTRQRQPLATDGSADFSYI